MLGHLSLWILVVLINNSLYSTKSTNFNNLITGKYHIDMNLLRKADKMMGSGL